MSDAIVMFSIDCHCETSQQHNNHVLVAGTTMVNYPPPFSHCLRDALQPQHDHRTYMYQFVQDLSFGYRLLPTMITKEDEDSGGKNREEIFVGE
ncbi:hypothetical protein RIF29_20271 [Crotalaria pallida]|uniref:Uncharacterized protein n=1 Tax=Crotalaria pallida TaxID=3830 RepID=A0AAN9I4V9_CROPI